jgi:phosphoribosylglycinamide formyltransferase-1
VDSGPIILQKAVEIKENDTEEILSQRILKQEHQLFSKAVALFFGNRLQIKGRRVIILS